ncbi:MAG: hypothetical protein AW07_02798 [Candidatus Accumulibacter sp. SK-11]|nr:MAG: hypothetical protein AW07_02798 [Candidatus Accumulibacter sp. SK-11]
MAPTSVAFFDIRTRAAALSVGWPGDAGALVPFIASGTDARPGRQSGAPPPARVAKRPSLPTLSRAG